VEGLGHDRLREPAALHADEERGLGIAGPNAEVVDEEGLDGRVDRLRGVVMLILGGIDFFLGPIALARTSTSSSTGPVSSSST